MNRLLSFSVAVSTVCWLTSLAVVLFATASCVVPALAVNVTLNLQYAGSYASDFTPKGFELNALPAPDVGFPTGNLPSDIHEFNIFTTITGLAAGEDMYSMSLDVVLGPGVKPLPLGAYELTSLDGIHDAGYEFDPLPNTTNGCLIGCQAVFTINVEAGPNTNDLKGIAIIANSVGDASFSEFAGVHYRHPGETEAASSNDLDNSPLGPNLYIGSFWVNWNGSVGTTGKSFVGIVNSPIPRPFYTHTSANALKPYGPEAFGQSPNMQWARAPEPSTLLLLGLGAISLPCYRRKGS